MYSGPWHAAQAGDQCANDRMNADLCAYIQLTGFQHCCIAVGHDRAAWLHGTLHALRIPYPTQSACLPHASSCSWLSRIQYLPLSCRLPGRIVPMASTQVGMLVVPHCAHGPYVMAHMTVHTEHTLTRCVCVAAKAAKCVLHLASGRSLRSAACQAGLYDGVQLAVPPFGVLLCSGAFPRVCRATLSACKDLRTCSYRLHA